MADAIYTKYLQNKPLSEEEKRYLRSEYNIKAGDGKTDTEEYNRFNESLSNVLARGRKSEPMPEIGEGGDTAFLRSPGFIGPPDLSLKEGGDRATVGPKKPMGPPDLSVREGSDVGYLDQYPEPGELEDEIPQTPEDKAQKTIATVLDTVSNNKDKLGKSPADVAGTESADDSGDQPETGSAVTFKEYSGISDQLKALKREEDDPAIKQKYTDAMDRAEKLYRDREDRVAWASLAETIGTGLLKLGMAQTAKQGVDLSKIQYEKPTDFEPTLSRYGRQYESSLDRARKEYQDTIAEARQKRGEERDALKEKAEALKLKYQSEVRAEEAEKDRVQRQREAEMREGVATKRLEESEKRQADRAAAAEAERQRQDKIRQENYERGLAKEQRGQQAQIAKEAYSRQWQVSINEEKEAQKQLQEAQSLANDLAREQDVSPKSRKKFQEKYGERAGRAGIELSTLADRLEAEETGPRIFGGKSTEEEQKAKQEVLKQLVLEKKNLLDNIRQRRSELESRIAAPSPDIEAPAPTKPAGPKLVKVKGPSGQVAEMTEENAKKYLGKQGYSLVE